MILLMTLNCLQGLERLSCVWHESRAVGW